MSDPNILGPRQQQFFDALAKRSLWIVGAVLALIVIAAGVVGFLNQREAKSHAASNALYQAQKSLDAEMKTFASSVVASKKAPQNQDEVSFRKTDVDSRFPESLKKFKEVSDQFPGTRAGFEAELSVGGLYSNHGEPAKAVDWYQKAVKSAPGSFDRALALSSLGSAQEGAGKYADAIQSYQKSMGFGEAALKGDLLLSIARNYELLGDKNQARSTYDQIVSQMPDTEQARSAALLKSRIQ